MKQKAKYVAECRNIMIRLDIEILEKLQKLIKVTPF